MKEKAIVIDVDNTLLTQSKRKQAILKDLFGRVVPINEIEEDFDLSKILQGIADSEKKDLGEIKTAFAKNFFSTEYYESENFTCIENAPEYVEKLAEKCQIIYLSARDYSLKEKTGEQLGDFGFPKVEDDRIIVLPVCKSPEEWTGAELEGFDTISLSFKEEALRGLQTKYDIIAGVGDSFSDLKAYVSNGILSVVICSPVRNIEKQVNDYNKKEKNKIDKYSYIVLDTWEEIYRYVSTITENDDKLEKICAQHANDYSKWMFDLDNKAYLILVAATFCITSLLSLLNKLELQSYCFKTLVLCGIVTSALSMFFAVQAFASRNTHGRSGLRSGNSDIPGIKQFLNKIWNVPRVLFGGDPLYTRAMADVIQSSANTDCVNKSKHAKVAYLKYFKERYGRLDPEEIGSKTLFALRNANYKKISSERYARLFLNITLVIMVVVSASYIFGDVSNQSTYSGTVSGEEYYISDTGNSETIFRLDDSCFAAEGLQLSTKGEQVLRQACREETGDYLICEIATEENYANERIRNYHNSIKYELVKEYIRDMQGKKDVIIIAK